MLTYALAFENSLITPVLQITIMRDEFRTRQHFKIDITFNSFLTVPVCSINKAKREPFC